jgi:hypothetical protein
MGLVRLGVALSGEEFCYRVICQGGHGMKIFLLILVVPLVTGCSSMYSLCGGYDWDDPIYQSNPQLQELWWDSLQAECQRSGQSPI